MKKKMFPIIIAPLIAVLIITAIIIGVIWFIQPYMFFFPSHDVGSYNQLKQNEMFEEIVIETDGLHLTGWLKRSSKNNSPLLIFYGGNAQNSSNACQYFLDNNIYDYFVDYNFLMVDYPGYGLSKGYPSDKTMFKAALSIYDYATNLKFVDTDNIVIMGYSIGTGSATYVASQRGVNGLILISPYDCALSLYNGTLDIFHGPLKLLARYKFNSIEYAQSVNVAPLIITSYDDEVIDESLSHNLATYFENDPHVLTMTQIYHSDYFNSMAVCETIKQYLSHVSIQTIEK